MKRLLMLTYVLLLCNSLLFAQKYITVGIGVSSTANKLSIHDSGCTQVLYNTDATSNDSHTAKLVAYDSVTALWKSLRMSGSSIIFDTYGAERMRILSSGGITFNGDTSASNALDDYEEGNFTPSFNGVTSNSSGQYTKIGNIVNVWVYTTENNLNCTEITGLPFAVNGGAYVGAVCFGGGAGATMPERGWADGTTIKFATIDGFGNSDSLTTIASGTVRVGLRLTYRTY